MNHCLTLGVFVMSRLPKTVSDFAIKNRLPLVRRFNSLGDFDYFIRDRGELILITKASNPTAKQAISAMKRYIKWQGREE